MLARVGNLCCWHCCRGHHNMLKRFGRKMPLEVLPQLLLLRIQYVQMTLHSYSTFIRKHSQMVPCLQNEVTASSVGESSSQTLTKYSRAHLPLVSSRGKTSQSSQPISDAVGKDEVNLNVLEKEDVIEILSTDMELQSDNQQTEPEKSTVLDGYRRTLWVAFQENDDISGSALRNLNDRILHAEVYEDIKGLKYALLTLSSGNAASDFYQQLTNMGLHVEYIDDMNRTVLVKTSEFREMKPLFERVCKKLNIQVSTRQMNGIESLKFNAEADIDKLSKKLNLNQLYKPGGSILPCLISMREVVYKTIDMKRSVRLGYFSADIEERQLRLLSPDIEKIYIGEEENLRYAFLQFASLEKAKTNAELLNEKGLCANLAKLNPPNRCLYLPLTYHKTSCMELIDMSKGVMEYHLVRTSINKRSPALTYMLLKFDNKANAQLTHEQLSEKGWPVKYLNQSIDKDFKVLFVCMRTSGLTSVGDVEKLCDGVVKAYKISDASGRYAVLHFASAMNAETNYKQLKEKGVLVDYVTAKPKDINAKTLSADNTPGGLDSTLLVGKLTSKESFLTHEKALEGIIRCHFGHLGNYRFAMLRMQSRDFVLENFLYLKNHGFYVKEFEATKLDENFYAVTVTRRNDDKQGVYHLIRNDIVCCIIYHSRSISLFFRSEDDARKTYHNLLKSKDMKRRQLKINFKI